MYGYLLQDWITIQGDSSIASITQSEADWMSFQKFQDIMFWTEVRAVTLAGATSMVLQFETAPTKDPTSFVKMQSSVLTVGNTPIFQPVLLSSATALNAALARWVRWTLIPTGGTLSGNWSATFCVSCAANTIMGG
jgi:hypothetical protein